MIKVDDFAIDMVGKITPIFKARATSHPLETNVAITDTVIDEPDGLLLTDCIVSNAPIGALVAIREREVGIPSENAFYRMLALKKSHRAVFVVTDHRVYVDMVLLDFAPVFDKDTGDALKFTLQFQALNLVTNERIFVQAPIATRTDSRAAKTGQKPPGTPADGKADRNSSILWKLTH